MAAPAKVQFYTDPECPWAWRTALWAIEAREVRPIEIEWRFFSLSQQNLGNDYAADRHGQSHDLMRTLILVRRKHGNDAVERLYLEFGDGIHGDRVNLDDQAWIRGCLERAGLDPNLHQAAMADPSTHDELMAEHNGAKENLGAFGVPTILFAGSDIAFFGPVIDPVPTGEAAGELWDHFSWFLTQSNAYEIKRLRQGRRGPQHRLRPATPARA